MQSPENDLLILDAGDLLFDQPNPSQQARDIAGEKMDLFIRAYNDMGYDVFNVGINDLALGVDFLKEHAKQADFPFISASLRNAEGALIFSPYTVLHRGDKKIGIVGVTSGNRMTIKVDFNDLLSSAVATREKLKGEVDYTILLASVNNHEFKRLQQELTGYNLIIRSHSSRLSRSLEKSGETYALQTGKDGKYLQVLEISGTSSSPDSLVDVSGAMQRMHFAKRRLEKLKADAGDGSLEEAYTESPTTQDFIERMQGQISEIEKQLANTENYIAYRYVIMGEEIRDDPEWVAEVREFQQQVNGEW